VVEHSPPHKLQSTVTPSFLTHVRVQVSVPLPQLTEQPVQV
jgi:hypothetical protein